eukprot:4929516-Prorocentrum_lima.AAC.1
MTSSLVGSEMCIRDRSCSPAHVGLIIQSMPSGTPLETYPMPCTSVGASCLLYTSDAADDM